MYEGILNGFQVIERRRFCDGQTDGQTTAAKTIYLPTLKRHDSKRSLPGVQTFELSKQICQNPKFKIFGLSPLPMQKTYSKTFLDIKFHKKE